MIGDRGHTVASTEVTFDTGGVRVRADIVAQRPDCSFYIVEAKNGPKARMTPNQTIGYPALASEGGIARGAKAELAGLPSGEYVPPMDVEVHYWNGV